MGKLLLAFLFFLASSAFAVHEARAPLRVVAPAPPVRLAERVNVPETADPTRFARPFYIRPLPAPPAPPPSPTTPTPPPPIEPQRVSADDNDSRGDIPDESDKCPLVDGERYVTDDDGCPEPAGRTIDRPRVMRIDIID